MGPAAALWAIITMRSGRPELSGSRRKVVYPAGMADPFRIVHRPGAALRHPIAAIADQLAAGAPKGDWEGLHRGLHAIDSENIGPKRRDGTHRVTQGQIADPIRTGRFDGDQISAPGSWTRTLPATPRACSPSSSPPGCLRGALAGRLPFAGSSPGPRPQTNWYAQLDSNQRPSA